MDGQLPPFTAPGAAKQYWSVLVHAAVPELAADAADEIDSEVAARVVLTIAGSEQARDAVASMLPEVSADEKLVHLVAVVMHDRLDVLDEAIAQALHPRLGADRDALRRALPILLEARSILAR